MTAYWLKFPAHHAGCVEANTPDEAQAQAKQATGQDPISCERLLYPANPRLGLSTSCPSFCHQPTKCAGKTSCPNRVSCVD